MSQLSDKELSLMTAMVKHFNGSLLGSIDWDNVAIEAGYKDQRNAKTMASRLIKKLTGASAGSASAADGEDGNVGEGSSVKAAATAAGGKKRKNAGTAQGEAAPVKAPRSAKKPKVKAESSAVDEVGAPKVKTEDHASDYETKNHGEEDAAQDSIA